MVELAGQRHIELHYHRNPVGVQPLGAEQLGCDKSGDAQLSIVIAMALLNDSMQNTKNGLRHFYGWEFHFAADRSEHSRHALRQRRLDGRAIPIICSHLIA